MRKHDFAWLVFQREPIFYELRLLLPGTGVHREMQENSDDDEVETRVLTAEERLKVLVEVRRPPTAVRRC
jgi:hypothetical protein